MPKRRRMQQLVNVLLRVLATVILRQRMKKNLPCGLMPNRLTLGPVRTFLRESATPPGLTVRSTIDLLALGPIALLLRPRRPQLRLAGTIRLRLRSRRGRARLRTGLGTRPTVRK